MDKTKDSTNSKIWPDSTCAISVRRKGQILLVVESLVLSTTKVLQNSEISKTLLIALREQISVTVFLKNRIKICAIEYLQFWVTKIT